jgi:hypothetical protein
MADDKHKPSGQTVRAGRGHRRAPPTIDLKATEVAAPEPPAEPAPPPDPSPEPVAAEAAPPQATAAPAREPEPALASIDMTPPEPPEPKAAGGPPPPPTATPWPMLGAAAGGGAAIVAIILLLLWGIPAGNSNAAQQAARIEKLEAAVRALAAREPPAAADQRTVASLAERVAQLETTRSAPNAQLEDRLSAIEKHIGSLSDVAAALRQRSDATAAVAESAQRRADAAAARAETAQATGAQGAVVDRQDFAALTDRLAALERAAQALQSDLARQRSNLAKERDTRADERAVRLAVVAEMLKAAVARGERFRAELDAAKALAPDQAALDPLAAFADTGVPTAAALGQQLGAALSAMRRAAEPNAAADGGFLKRLQVNAERLVRIQPIGERPGDDASAILARVEAKASRGDIARALAELATLPPAVREPAQDWVKAAQAREAAIDASRRFAAAHVGALAGRSD